jgi:hypothetical protein
MGTTVGAEPKTPWEAEISDLHDVWFFASLSGLDSERLFLQCVADINTAILLLKLCRDVVKMSLSLFFRTGRLYVVFR